MNRPRCTCWEQAFFCGPPDPEPGETEVDVVECEGETVARCKTRALAEWLRDMLNMLPADALPAVSECKACQATGYGRKNMDGLTDLQLDHEEAKDVLSLIGEYECEYGSLPRCTVPLRDRIQKALRAEVERAQLAREARDPDSSKNIMVTEGTAHEVGIQFTIHQLEQRSRDATDAAAQSLADGITNRANAITDMQQVEAVVQYARDRIAAGSPIGDPDDRAVLLGSLLSALRHHVRIGWKKREADGRPGLFLEVQIAHEHRVRVDLDTVRIDLDTLEVR
jgi:hypothetical protein